jgi:RNA polymerase sigma-70 factor (ECF subfamily)
MARIEEQVNPKVSYAGMDNAALIELCLAHDEQAWAQIVERFRRRVFHIAYKFTGRHGDAEDLTQEIFLRLLRILDRFRRDADFGTWLTSVARNHCIDHYRATKRERELLVRDMVGFDTTPARSGNPHRAVEDSDRRGFVRRGLERLPPKLREAVILRDLMELSYQEMAERLELPEGTVKSRINRGREELARILLRARQDTRRGGANGRPHGGRGR